MKSFILITFLLMTPSAWAISVTPMYLMGAEFGGDNITGLSGKAREPIAAGSGYLLTAGLVFDIDSTRPHSYEARLHFGFNTWFKDDLSNVSVSWTSFPLNFEYFYVNHRNHLKIGYGLTYRFSNSVYVEGNGVTDDIRFKNALGHTAAIEYFNGEKESGIGSVGLRYSWIDYQESTSGQKFSGNSLALYTSITL